MCAKIVKTIAFIAVFCLLFTGFSWLFRPASESFGSSIIHYESPNTIDVLFTGSSHIYANINPNILWREEGIAAFDYAGSAQTVWTSYYFIQEAVKRQNPLLVVLDIHMVCVRCENNLDDPARQTVYKTFPFSLNKLDMVRTGAESGARVPWIVDLLRFHIRWRDVSSGDMPYSKQQYMRESMFRYNGFCFLTSFLFGDAKNQSDYSNVEYPATNEMSELPEKNLMYLLEIIELSKKEGFELLLVKTPTPEPFENIEIQKRYNTVRAIAEENGITFIDYNENRHRDAMGFDFATDLSDNSGHSNISGQTKLSKYLASYLKAEYDIPDRRGDPGYQSWDEAADRYFLYEAMESAKQITELPAYLDALKDISQNLIFVTGVRGGADAELGVAADRLSQIGITENMMNGSYICVYEPSSGYLYESNSPTKKLSKNIYKEYLPINLEVVSAGSESGNILTIKINGKEVAKNRVGLNIAIYDKNQEKVYDYFTVDTSTDAEFIIKR